MNCSNCGSQLSTNLPGFIVCPVCHTVNIYSASLAVSAFAIPQDSASATAPWLTKIRSLTSGKQTRLLGACLAIALLVLGVTAAASYQIHQASLFLASAKTSIAQEHYAAAATFLKRADSYYALPATKKEIGALQAADKQWITDEGYLQHATVLAHNNQFADAQSQLDKIDTRFPGYKKVTLLATSIQTQQKAIADAQAVAKAVAVAQVAKPSVVKSTVTQPTTAAIATANGKRFASVAALSTLTNAKTIAQAQQALQAFASQYGLTMQITSVSPSSYVSLYDTYSILSEADLGNLKTYGSLFIDEWAKYPTDWVSNSKLKSVVLVKNLAVSGTIRSATPDPFGHAMYYSVSYSGDYAREVVHHEYDHLVTYNYFGSYAPSDPVWSSYNTPGFSYGNGGASCYLPGNSCLTGNHPIPGFVSGYAASAIEEDKAELYGYLMDSADYHLVKGWVATDTRLANKVNAYKQFIASHSSQMSGSYFDDVNP